MGRHPDSFYELQTHQQEKWYGKSGTAFDDHVGHGAFGRIREYSDLPADDDRADCVSKLTVTINFVSVTMQF